MMSLGTKWAGNIIIYHGPATRAKLNFSFSVVAFWKHCDKILVFSVHTFEMEHLHWPNRALETRNYLLLKDAHFFSRWSRSDPPYCQCGAPLSVHQMLECLACMRQSITTSFPQDASLEDDPDLEEILLWDS